MRKFQIWVFIPVPKHAQHRNFGELIAHGHSGVVGLDVVVLFRLDKGEGLHVCFFNFHWCLSNNPPHGVSALHHSLNFLCKNTGLFCVVLLNPLFNVQSVA